MNGPTHDHIRRRHDGRPGQRVRRGRQRVGGLKDALRAFDSHRRLVEIAYGSKDTEDLRARLRSGWQLTELEADLVLSLTPRQMTGTHRSGIRSELDQLMREEPRT